MSSDAIREIPVSSSLSHFVNGSKRNNYLVLRPERIMRRILNYLRTTSHNIFHSFEHVFLDGTLCLNDVLLRANVSDSCLA